jgi:hypothetical protein
MEWRCAYFTRKFNEVRESVVKHQFLEYFITYLLTYLHSYLLTYLHSYLLTPWSRVFLEKLTGFQLLKKFLAFYGTRRFITSVTCAYHLSLSWASSIQYTTPHPTSWKSILIFFHLRLGVQSGLSFRFPHQNTVYASPLLHTRYLPRNSFLRIN